MKCFKHLLPVLFLVISIQVGSAQEMKAEKYDNPQWVRISYIKFSPMKKDPAMEIINNYFAKADEDAGIAAPTTYHFPFGEYDMMVIWEIRDGIEELNYKMTPEDAEWMKSMAKIAGGQDKAMAKFEEFTSYIEDWKNTIARKE
ncbi:hypothetical protein MKO06_01695 [Gramella sp. GC03-9]|uniref:NIPSNAP domain-containing protein n=1 Tax=Christiangramia oceanisediminis TaxID=2920386 RepID=A0A9X2KX88_9FLAO|nr:hypothetical protein [Gramella oceanisediminis]MCP9198601.1 hypothetical protein [Gramella oceanisediminis]